MYRVRWFHEVGGYPGLEVRRGEQEWLMHLPQKGLHYGFSIVTLTRGLGGRLEVQHRGRLRVFEDATGDPMVVGIARKWWRAALGSEYRDREFEVDRFGEEMG